MPESSLDTLIAALRDPRRYPHPVESVEVLETHASFVLLAGAYAYKIKKPVSLGFLDFSTLASRRFYCAEELRLNRRTAPFLYLDVVTLSGEARSPVLGGDGSAIEYALRMRRFAQEALLDRMARRGALSPRHIDLLARATAAFHGQIDRAAAGSAYGSPVQILASALQNFDQMLAMVEEASDADRLRRLQRWTIRTHAALGPRLEARRRGGFVRECHGDLHLGNIALLDDTPTPFDGIEFNPELRWIDVMSEIAFLVMDLLDHALTALAFRFLNGYLEATGDYAGLRVFRFYCVYRALVRAKVSCIRAHQVHVVGEEKERLMREYRGHLELAERLRSPGRRALVLMHGLSGSGKTAVAQRLLESFGAIRLRSDVERKRLHGAEAQARTDSGLDSGIYAPPATRRTYTRLADLARELLATRTTVIVDAAFLRREQRDAFHALARGCAAPLAVVWCRAPEAVMRERLARREGEGKDASEAGVAVLERQLQT
ncbi:MAG: AAA family ATPase, partial [Betaproteobacteria bacterium]|nr:AAA family ATPase [Betaproteobacteria bacterium]